MGNAFSTPVYRSDPADFATPINSVIGDGYKAYDYIIVGAGAAGSVLAHRLSEDPNVTVLLIEAGLQNNNIYGQVPSGSSKLWRTPYDWNYYTTPQAELYNRQIFQPRGKVLGGSTTINALIYQHAANSDLEEWERLGAKGWGPKDLAPYYRSSEKFTPHVEFPIEHEHRGAAGLWQTGYTYTAGINKSYLKGCTEYGIPHNPDVNTPRGSEGITRAITFTDANGRRSSAATAYLTPDVLARPNLTVAIENHVTRVLFKTGDGKPKAIGVEVAKSEDSLRYRVKAKREVIISSGAFGSPQLLQLSGIGSKEDVHGAGIPLVKELPHVGRNLSDHLTTGTLIYEAKGETLDWYGRHPVLSLPWLFYWLFTGQGPLASNVAEIIGFIRAEKFDKADKPGAPPVKFEECASSPESADVELLSCSVYFNELDSHAKDPGHNCVSVMGIHLRPFSVGTVKIKSSSVFEHPAIDTNYLSHPNDLKVMVRAIRINMKIARETSFRDHLVFEPDRYPKEHDLWLPNQDPDDVDDEDIIEFIRRRAQTLYHPVASCRMGKDESSSVVDSDLKVWGVDGLRVVDASVFPAQITGHPTATVIALAEKIAVSILASHEDAVIVNI